jgi:polyketide synthase PksL
MVDFIEYIVAELKSKRLSKPDAASLVKQFSIRPSKPGSGALLHPLVQQNMSDLHGQSYASTFTGDEFFLADHQLQPNGRAAQRVLPGVAYLEMARAAIEDALPGWPEGAFLELRNTVWAQPIVVAGQKEIHVALMPGGEDEIEYEIYSHDGNDEIVHGQGRAVLDRQATPGAIDLKELERQMTAGTLAPGDIYTACAQMGLVYGPSMQSIVTIRRGSGQMLAQLRIPAAVADQATGYVLHPSVMDGALQAAAGLFETASGSNPRLPFALETLRVASPCKPEMVAWVRLAPGSHAGSAVAKLDIDLCDDLGNVCVQMRGLSWRELSVQRAEAGSFMAVPVWQASGNERAAGPVEFAEQHLLVCEPIPGKNVAERYTEYAVACFERVQSILQSRTSGTVLLQVVVPDDPEQALLAGLTALLRTASLESPRFTGQVLLVPPDSTSEDMTRYLEDEKARGLDPLVRYRDLVRQVLHWQEVPAAAEAAPVAFEDGRVYLITGGMGGLGTLFANEILARTKDAKVVLTGRSARFADRDRVVYRATDLADLRQVEELISWIRAEHGRLDGILHCAGVLADDFILRKPVAGFAEVLAPKVTGTFNLDYATRDEGLGFMVLFSAIGGATGNVGQADYAAANAFLDRFAAYRNAQVAAGQRHGRTRSINWPLWQAGGMRVDPASQERLQQATGMRPMDTAAGLQAFHRTLALPHDQTLVMEGDLARIRRAFLTPAAPQVRESERIAPDVAIDPDSLAEPMQDYLRKQFSGVLKVPVSQLDPRVALENYGIDSIVAMNLTNQLEITFGSLPKTLFFEYQTIRDLAGYFIADHAAKSATVLAPDRKIAGDAATPAVPVPVAAPAKLVSSRRFARARTAAPAARPAASAAHPAAEPIAIIGLSGRYPEAVDIEAYWHNLRDGKDCITEVPKERWDWREYFSDDRTKDGHHYSKWGGFIEGIDEFDPLFFNISPLEAEQMDPQERLFLQHAWMAIEDAGYTRAALQLPDAQDLPGQVGVYVGLMYTEYQMLGAAALARGRRVGVASSASSIANRVSYLLNLHGPSMTLDTMCSSSLTAIHLACQDLKQGRTSLAIAGGVNVSIHPNKYFVLSGGQFISSDGHCQSFGEGGDGYIPGEGVGVVALKRLSDAKRDGDHIYGVIRGSALNHGGKTNGYTVPSPQAQASVIRRALAESGVDARHISYIEAHGTGTKLGDPIEIAALSKAFGPQPDTGFCPIGSAKSNIGHAESAAGIAGLTKVLLQMQHRQIVPSLHSTQLNPHIDFEKTPFIVNQTLRPWEQPVVDGRPVPRIAGISSFGAGGSNAHMIIEEYQPPAVQPVALPYVAIVLSARTTEQLRQRVQDLLQFLRSREETIDLAAVAYTLQVGREAMEERLGCVVRSVEELVAKLEAWVAGSQDVEDLHHGQVKRNREALSLFGTDTDLQQAVEKWIENRKITKLLELWVKGLDVDWSRLYGETRPPRTSLPVYPFAKERYWVDAGMDVAGNGSAAVLHPLLHANTSDLTEQRYSSTFTGEEFFFADHQVQADGRTAKVLPAVAYLEMARAAIERALPAPPDSAVLELRNTAWSQPIVASGKTQVDIALIAADDDQVDYEIYSGDTVHCQGRAVWSGQSAAPRLDLEQLRGRMDRGALDAERVYAACARMGLAYGPAFRAVTSVLRGNGEVLAQLTLPPTPSAGDYVLHPSVMDGALQAAIGLLQSEDEPVALRLPFALDTLRVLWPCSGEMAAWVRIAPDPQPGDPVVKLEVDLCDARGIVCVELRGLALRALPEQLRPAAASLFAAPVWRTDESSVAVDTTYAEQHVMVLQADARQNIAEHYTDSAVACFERIQDIFRRKPEGKVLFQVVVADDGEQRLFAGLGALLRTARMENPQFTGQLLLVPASTAGEELERWWRDEADRPAETLVRYRDGARQVLRWEEVAAGPEQAPAAFKDDGVYLITGGAGGLGLLFARDILERTGDARVILTGRRMRELPVRNERLSYRQVDLVDAEQVERLIASIRDEYGRLDGILHSAGVIADRLLLTKTAAELRDVLAPKVTGTFHLDRATSDVELDFFVLFSSLAGALGNVGQADYATANAFMDEFAAHRNRQTAAGERHGRTRSINWPLWEAGGMTVDPAVTELLERTAGIRPMQTATGLDALHRALAWPHDQVLIVEGDAGRMRRALLAGPVQPAAPVTVTVSADVPVDMADLVEKTQELLRKEFSAGLKLPLHKIDPQAALENYGIDSVLAMRLTNQLEQIFGSLSKTLFFEYQTIAAMAGYFAKAHSAILREKFSSPAVPAAAKAAVDRTPAPAQTRRRKRAAAAKAKPESEIAIVGLAGRYPQAENVQAFWKNLRNGLDCITEIPADRWDHALYFDSNPNSPGMTYSKWGGFVSGVDKFDPLFFNISPREAALIDPQERLFLETAWECIEDAGYTKESISGSRVGVFVGAMWGHYELFGAEAVARGEAVLPISSHASIANRVSYVFDLHGPSIALDTMCSSSLTAIHLACEALRKGTIGAALAGGVNLTIHPYKYLSLSQGRFIASDGRCRSFGAGGDGYVPGEGAGAVLLKRLDDALRDGDQIYAVVRSSTLNHGGKTNGYTVPNPVAQGDLIVEAFRQANIDPKTVGYIETHGTGTSLGDPIEITGLLKAFEGVAGEQQFLPIGSVKSNIGHLESAAGIAAVTKALLQIRHKQLVPSLHASPLNPNIDFAKSPFYVQTELAEWKSKPGQPRRVAVSSFGAGGSNGHVILEEYPRRVDVTAESDAAAPELFLLSAKNPDALRRYAERVVRFLEDGSDVSLRDLAFTSQVGRTPMDVRLAIVASTLDDLGIKLQEWLGLSTSGGDASDLENVFYGNMKEAQFRAAGVIDGQAGKAFLRELLTRRDLGKIASLWTSGVAVDWSLLERTSTPGRVSLPTYPFARERCWIEQTPSVRKIEIAKTAAPAPPEDKRVLHYFPEWTAKPLSVEEETGPIGPILILDETDRLFLAMRERYGDDSVVWVRPGETFGEIEPNVYVVDPEREEHFRDLLAGLQEKALFPALIVHHAPDPCVLKVHQDVARELQHTLYSLLFLTKAMLLRKQQTPPRLVSLFSSEGDATPPLGAAVGGFFRTLTLEDPRYLAKAIEIPGELSVAGRVDLLGNELRERDWTTQEIRYRGDVRAGMRAIRGLTPRPVPAAPASELPLRRNGVYLITGGMGGLGLIFARHLATTVQAKLVLVGRSAPNAARIAELEAAGAEVLYVQADVVRKQDVQRVVREAKERFSEIHGVIHAAGVHRDAFVLRKTKEEMEAVLAPKIYGAINLDRATRRENLELFVLFASVAGVLGNVGQADYAYANRFLDCFAERREYRRSDGKRSGRTLSIDWPLWEAGGMSISPEDVALLEKRVGIVPLPMQDGLRIWEDFLRSDATQAAAVYGIPSRIAAFVNREPAAAPRKAAAPDLPSVAAASLVAKTETYVKTFIGREIGLDPERIDPSDRLDSFGIDSLMIQRINAQLESDLGALPKTLFYEHETIGAVAKFLVRQSREALAALFGAAAGPAEDAVAEAAPAEVQIRQRDEPVPEESALGDDVAIIGVHTRLPHSSTMDEYWENLREGRNLIDLVPPDRWDRDALYHPDPAAAAAGKIYCKWGGFIEDHDKFDPRFFQISGAEAKLMDPQERLFLQSVWAAIEDAGYTRDRLKARHPKGQSANVGVFVGVTTNTYHLLAPEERMRGNFVTPSAMPWSIANRVSYFFDFNGPSMPVDAACSSSLVAIHLACESLRKSECELAIAGGVNLYLHPSKYHGLCQRRALSVDGKCRSYGAGGEGFVPGEGVGTLILKPLSKAVEDGDRIYAVIRASASEHSGRSHGYSAPNPTAQASLVGRTLEQARVDPESVGYVEGHGTGMQMGDAVELAALTQAFRRQTEKNQFCAIGSVKANIGHTESAAGIAAVAKVILQLQHRQLAPAIHAGDPNPDIAFADTPFYLQDGLSEWSASGGPRRAIVHTFGAGGVNACLILEEHEPETQDNDAQEAGPFVFTLSARNEERLHEYVDHMLTTLRQQPRIDLASLCYTLQTGREAMEERLATVVTDVDQLVERLAAWKAQGSADVHRGSTAPRRGPRRMTAAAAADADAHVLNRLASRWVAGEDVDWSTLHRVPRLVTLPTYPFARERYWVADSLAPSAQPAPQHGQLHPLLGYNSSTLQEVSFSSTLSEDAFYAVDHKVGGEGIFPGAGYLEMACIAATIAGEQRVRKLTGIVWASPLSFRNGAQAVRTTLRPNGDGIEFEISSLDEENEKLVHSEGKLILGNGPAPVADGEDRMVLEALKERSAKKGERMALYETFSAYGLHYGPSFQTVQELYVNGSFALAKLKVAEHLQAEFGKFILHPAIIDGALQTVVGLVSSHDATTAHLPFALDEIDIIRPVPRTCYAYVERADAQSRAGVATFNIRILNEGGDVLVRMNNLYVRPFGQALPVSRSVAAAVQPPPPRLDEILGESIN